MINEDKCEDEEENSEIERTKFNKFCFLFLFILE